MRASRSRPDVGGAIASFALAGSDILRPTPRRRARGARRAPHACYPLVPYLEPDRERDAARRRRATTRSSVISATHPHAIHGVGWQRTWTIVDATSTSAQLALDHDATGDEAVGLAMVLSRNADLRVARRRRRRRGTGRGVSPSRTPARQAFPFGLGWHPFFPSPSAATLAFDGIDLATTTTRCFRSSRVAVPTPWRYATARRRSATSCLDHVFEPSTGAATIAWPDARLAVTIDATRALDRRVVFVRAEGRDFLAFEPATHMTDAFNRAARGAAGYRAPGSCLRATSFSCTMRLHCDRRDATMTASPFRCVLDVKASLGECPVWSVAEQVLYWVDINAPSLNRFDPATGDATRAMPMPSSIGSFALRARGGFVVALRDGVWLADAPTARSSARSPTRPTIRRIIGSTTARCDRAGTLLRRLR